MRRTVIRIFFLFSVMLMFVTISGCGYHVGSIAHPQIKTVAIADVKNETYEVLASAILRNILAERFQFDNSLKLTSMEKADCIVYTRIVSVQNSSVTWRTTDKIESYRANEYSLAVRVEFTVLRPGYGQPLVPRRFANAMSMYLFSHDPAIGRASALKQCMLRISDQIVSATTEAW